MAKNLNLVILFGSKKRQVFLLKKIFVLALASALMLSCVSCSNKDNDTGAHKPSLMYNGDLYSISSEKIGTYSFDSDNELELIGDIKDSVDGTKLAEKDMQISGNDDLVGCNVYVSKLYPKHVFVYDNEGNYVAFITE